MTDTTEELDRFQTLGNMVQPPDINGNISISVEDYVFLVSEVERLRKIEDAAIEVEPKLCHVSHKVQWLLTVLRDNPRPGSVS